MKAVFFHDTRLKYDSKLVYYTSNGLTKELFARYNNVFEHINVVVRKEAIDESYSKGKYSLSSGNNVEFDCIEKLSVFSLFFGKDRQTIREQVTSNDVAIVRMPSIIGIVAWAEAKKQKKPYIVEIVACVWDSLWNYGKIKYRFVAPVLFLINRYIIYNSLSVSYVSQFLKVRYPTRGSSQICSDVQLHNLQKKDLEDRIVKINKNKSPKVKLGTVANVDMKYKGQQYVIQAISELNDEGYYFEYYLAGDGDNTYLDSLAEKYGLKEQVCFVGSLKHDDVFDFMRDIDIYVQPSNAESHGRVIIEAFSVGCPTIGSSTGGIPELVDAKYIFKRKNVNDLKLKLRELTASKLSLNAIRDFNEAEKYAPGVLDKKWNAFYERVSQGKEIKHD